MKIDINDCIDMITILPVIACFAEGKTEIVNAGIARKKESDRVHAITTELQKMGAIIEEYPDSLLITPTKLHGAHVKSYSDHRMTLALSVAAMGAQGDSQIDGAECIAKTYQNFAEDFRALGAQILCT
jgi:3-phosphoshikimate 1-carboxyvinyltransferase